MSNQPNIKLVLAGKISSGKSTIANILTQQNLFEKNRLQFNKSDENGDSWSVDVVDGQGWTVCDITDLCYLKRSERNNITKSERLLSQISREGVTEDRQGFNTIAFVTTKDSAIGKNQETEMYLQNFKQLFNGAKSNFVLIVTHLRNKDSKDWIEENQKELIKTYGEWPVIGCDFVFDEGDPFHHFEDRERELRDFEEELKSFSKSPADPGSYGPKEGGFSFWKYPEVAVKEFNQKYLRNMKKEATKDMPREK